MQKNYFWKGQTCFYYDLENKTYGVRINENDKRSTQDIINKAFSKYEKLINNMEVLTNE